MSELISTVKTVAPLCGLLAAFSFMAYKARTKQAVVEKVRPILVGVSGGSGSGKTTVVSFLQKWFTEAGVDVAVLHLDHYYKDLSHLPIEERAVHNFDHPDSLDFDLFFKQVEALGQGKTILRPSYDFATHARVTERVQLKPSPVIIVDGILSLHEKNLRDLYDMTVFVSTTGENRFQRRLERDQKERGRDRESIQRQWDTFVAPMHDMFVEPCKDHANVVLKWDDSDAVAESSVAASNVRKYVFQPVLQMAQAQQGKIRV